MQYAISYSLPSSFALLCKALNNKAKVERFFRTLKDQYLCRIKPNDYSDLGTFNKDLKNYIQRYNTRPHSSLENNMSPNGRFYQESKLIIEMSEEQIEKSFLL